VRDGWSLKRAIRRIMLSQTYRMSSRPDPRALQVDPGNLLLQHARVRRLEGEAIRDTILQLSGRTSGAMYGPSIFVHLTQFMQGRGRPASGPIDGDGRRSIYLGVRRNFLSPLMLAFDMPAPFSTMGRRTVSNVPAQALILMNDPLVLQESRRWAQRVLAIEGLSPAERIERLYLEAFSRPPTAMERDEALAFLKSQAAELGLPADRFDAPGPWADLCHVLLNVKEFIFVR